MRRTSFAPLVLAVLIAAGGCGGEPSPSPQRASLALVNDAPVPTGAVRVSASEGIEAVEAVYRAALVPDSVVAWYRRWFLANTWRITSDTRLPDGTFVIHADGKAKPLWIMIRADAGGTSFSIMAADPGAAR